ncbi:MAG: AarF/UbiB family protein [Pseudomonadota bacterium]
MLAAFGDYWRLMRAGASLARHDVILPGEYQSRLPVPARLAGRILRLFGGGAKGRPGQRLATALEKLGPAYIKMGQFLATRPDVFGVEATTDLSRLKDKLPPFSMDKARAALEAEFPEDASQLFAGLGEPIAAASLAQVHKLETGDGTKAVKILRPGIESRIFVTLRAMGRASRNIEKVSSESRRLQPVAFTDTIAESMSKELDLRLEAGGADELRAIKDASEFYVVPEVDWQRTSKRVLTTEWIDGKPLTAPDALEGSHVDRTYLANCVTRGFLTHAIHHGVFHADMHEGNMIVTPEGKLALVDFGIVGRIGTNESRFLAEILWGFIRRDYHRIAEVHFEAGYVPPDRSVGDFAQALRSVGEPIHGKNAKDVSMGKLLLQLFDYTHQFGMQLRPELVLLQKTMVQVEGVARAIDPSHDIWTAAEPIVSKWIRTNFGPEGAAKLAAQNVREIANRLKRLPDVMDRFEASLDAQPPVVAPQKSRFAPWWGWFGFTITMTLIVAVAAISLAP